MLKEGDDPAGRPVRACGFKVRVEWPAGSTKVKRNRDDGSVMWTRKMKNDYGYIVGVKGADGDSFDCFLCPEDARVEDAPVYVVHQLKSSGGFDEDKAFIGYPSRRAAVATYRDHCHDFKKLYGGISEYPAEDFAEEYGADFAPESGEAADVADGSIGASAGGVDVFAGGMDGADVFVCPVAGRPVQSDEDGLAGFVTWLAAVGWDTFRRPQPASPAEQQHEAVGPGFVVKGGKKKIDALVAGLPESVRARTKVGMIAENIAIGELGGLVAKKVSIDEYVAKDGGDNVVVAFYVLGASTAVEPLRAFCEASPWVVLADSGDSDTEKNISIVYCEMDRAKITPERLESLVTDVCRVSEMQPREVEVAFPGAKDKLYPFSLRTMEAFVAGVRAAGRKAAIKEAAPGTFWCHAPTGEIAPSDGAAPTELSGELQASGWVKCDLHEGTGTGVLCLESASLLGALLAAKRVEPSLTMPLSGVVVKLGHHKNRGSVFESIRSLEAVAASRRWTRASA